MRRSFIGFAALWRCRRSPRRAVFRIKGGLSYGNVSNSGALPVRHAALGDCTGVSALTGGAWASASRRCTRSGITSSWPAHRRGWTISTFLYVRLAMPTPGISPFIYAGPQVSFELKCGTQSGNCPTPGGRRRRTPGHWRRPAFDAFMGLSVEGRYVYGLTDLNLNTVSTSESYQTRSFLLLAGISF